MEYEEFVMTVRRDINCLSGDRNLKRNALVRLDSIVKGGNVSDEVLCRLFVEELHGPLFRLFCEASEKCRELSLSMTRRFIDVVPLESLAILLPLLLSALLGRFRPLPFPEQSEELRLDALQLLGVLHAVHVLCCSTRSRKVISASESDAGCGRGRMLSPSRKWSSAATGTLRSTQGIGVAGISRFEVAVIDFSR